MSEPLDLRLAGPAAAAWLVAWQGRLLPVPWLLLLAAVSGAAAALALRRGRAVVAAVAVCAAAAALSTGARVHARTTGPLVEAADRAAAVAVTGTLVDDPRVVPARGDVLAFRQVVVATLRVTSLSTGGRAFRVRQPVLVVADSSWLGLLPSQRVRAEGRLQAPDRGDAVAAVLSVRGRPEVRSRPSWLQAAAGRLRRGMRDAASPLPHDERGLLPGLVDGDTSQLDPRLQADFRRVGLTHLVAVSGTNVPVRQPPSGRGRQPLVDHLGEGADPGAQGLELEQDLLPCRVAVAGADGVGPVEEFAGKVPGFGRGEPCWVGRADDGAWVGIRAQDGGAPTVGVDGRKIDCESPRT